MARKHYSEDEVLRALKRKKDCRIANGCIAVLHTKVWSNVVMDYIVNPLKIFDLGNGSWGKIDFLIKKCGYFLYYTDKF